MADNNRGGSSTNEITYYLNIENAKILAFCIVCGFVMYHGVLHLKYGKPLNEGLYEFYNETPSSYNAAMQCVMFINSMQYMDCSKTRSGGVT